jgi:hypothetical protein
MKLKPKLELEYPLHAKYLNYPSSWHFIMVNGFLCLC